MARLVNVDITSRATQLFDLSNDRLPIRPRGDFECLHHPASEHHRWSHRLEGDHRLTGAREGDGRIRLDLERGGQATEQLGIVREGEGAQFSIGSTVPPRPCLTDTTPRSSSARSISRTVPRATFELGLQISLARQQHPRRILAPRSRKSARNSR
jgi:hypothetical protein